MITNHISKNDLDSGLTKITDSFFSQGYIINNDTKSHQLIIAHN